MNRCVIVRLKNTKHYVSYIDLGPRLQTCSHYDDTARDLDTILPTLHSRQLIAHLERDWGRSSGELVAGM